MTALSPVLVILLRKRYIAYVTAIILMIMAMLDINTPLCQTSSVLLFTLGGTLSVYHREYWEKPNGNHFETEIYIILFLICAVLKWLLIPFFTTIYIVVVPILFWKSCGLMGQWKVFDDEFLWFCKQSFFIYSAHIFIVEGLSSIMSRVSSNMLWVSFSYLVNPLIALAFLYVAARVLDQRFTKLYGLLCGNRI